MQDAGARALPLRAQRIRSAWACIDAVTQQRQVLAGSDVHARTLAGNTPFDLASNEETKVSARAEAAPSSSRVRLCCLMEVLWRTSKAGA